MGLLSTSVGSPAVAAGTGINATSMNKLLHFMMTTSLWTPNVFAQR